MDLWRTALIIAYFLLPIARKKHIFSFECTIHVNNSEPRKNYRYASWIKTSDVELLPVWPSWPHVFFVF